MFGHAIRKMRPAAPSFVLAVHLRVRACVCLSVCLSLSVVCLCLCVYNK